MTYFLECAASGFLGYLVCLGFVKWQSSHEAGRRRGLAALLKGYSVPGVFHGKHQKMIAKVMFVIGIIAACICVGYGVIIPDAAVSGHASCLGLGALMHGFVSYDLANPDD